MMASSEDSEPRLHSDPPARGRFITFEGGEGAGKSTQIRALAAALSARGVRVVLTREPGGSEGAEALRTLLVIGGADRWSPLSEALLMFAARNDHLERVIRPALARGDWVLCDRFADSTRAYQGAGGGVDPAFVETLDAAVVGPDQPDLTLILDLPVSVGLARAQARNGAGSEAEARFEGKGLAFHERLRSHFQALATRFPERCVLIESDQSIETLMMAVLEAVETRLGLPPVVSGSDHV
jgi:dTMP kinase